MNFAEAVLQQREREAAKTRLDDDQRIRAQARKRATVRLQITDADTVAAFVENSSRARAAGADPEPSLLHAQTIWEKAA